MYAKLPFADIVPFLLNSILNVLGMMIRTLTRPMRLFWSGATGSLSFAHVLSPTDPMLLCYYY